jgi:hypothetical protein
MNAPFDTTTKPKAVPLKVNVPAVKSAKVPAPKVKREWREFDDFIALAETLKSRVDGLWKHVEAIPDVFDDDDDEQPSAIALANAMYILRGEKLDERRMREFDELLEYFEREELYEPTKGKKMTPDLLGCHNDRVISRRVVSEQVGMLIGSFPNAGPHSPEVYTRMLIEEIIAAKPSAVALEACCREIRRTKTFIPTVAEVLKVLRDQMEKWESQRLDIIEWDQERWRKMLSDKLQEAKKRWPEIAQKAEAFDAKSRKESKNC